MFITHEMAKKNDCKKLRVMNLTVRTLSGEHVERTFIYLVLIWSFLMPAFTKI